MSETIRLRVNGDWREFEPDLSLADLLDQLDIAETRGLAVARNDHVVPRSTWDAEVLEDGDRLEIIRATQGG